MNKQYIYIYIYINKENNYIILFSNNCIHLRILVVGYHGFPNILSSTTVFNIALLFAWIFEYQSRIWQWFLKDHVTKKTDND